MGFLSQSPHCTLVFVYMYVCVCVCVCEWGRNVYVCAHIHAYNMCVCVCVCMLAFVFSARNVPCLFYACVFPLLYCCCSFLEKKKTFVFRTELLKRRNTKVCVCLTWKVTEGPPQERAKTASLSAKKKKNEKMKQRRYLCIFDCAYVVSLLLLLTLGWSSRRESLEVCRSHGVSLGQMEPLVLL